ncbi:hypothetical protein [Clostridium hydrogenum]|uniref:hypothetical protein n=1 Tax=Clostridium hydrogenum TaxID=2855764 RepID=UPI001F340A35|nr:hypothetical protein [Clostridium hydrogenum]
MIDLFKKKVTILVVVGIVFIILVGAVVIGNGIKSNKSSYINNKKVQSVSKNKSIHKNAKDNANSLVKNQNNTANVNGSAKGQNNSASTFNYKDYFGEWTIKKSIGTSPVSAMSSDQIASYVGKKIIISADQFTDLDGTVLKNPTYKQKNVLNSEFINDTHRQLSYFKITSNYINEIEVDNNGGMYSNIYIIDKDNIMYSVNGVFFQLQK